MRKYFGKCSWSVPTIGPKGATVSQDWYVQFYYHDPAFNSHPGKLFIKKAGINEFKTLDKKKAAAVLAQSDISKLLNDGWNPITGKYMALVEYGMPRNTPIIEALNKAAGQLKVAHSTSIDIKSMLNVIKPVFKRTGFDSIPVAEIELMHIKIVLDALIESRPNFGAASYNRARSYLQMLFKELTQLGAVKYNPVRELAKMKEVIKERAVIPKPVRKAIVEHFQKIDLDFLLFLQVFYSSGARITELAMLQHEDIDIEAQQFRVTVTKGRNAQQHISPIPDAALKYWKIVKDRSVPGQYVFSRNFLPGDAPVYSKDATKIWKCEVKDKMKLPYDLYALKHTNLTELAQILGIEDTAGAARHKSTAITLKHYVKGEKLKQDKRLREAGGEM